LDKEPRVVKLDDVQAVTPSVGDSGRETTTQGIKVRRLITKKRVGSGNLTLGITYLDLGTKGYRWTFANNDEVYYVLKGKIRLHYGNRKVDAQEGDAVFLPSGVAYELDNAGTEKAMLVYVLNPGIE
jgi:putative monooxygenase